MSEANLDPSHLLSQLEDILDSDPCIDEVGFVHPSLFAGLDKEVQDSLSSSSGAATQLPDEITKPTEVQGRSSSTTHFWHSGQKLGISTDVLVPLYSAATNAFLNAFKQYKLLSNTHVQKDELLDDNKSMPTKSFLDIVESEVMKHSRALLLLSCDFGTAWNSRKLIVSKKKFLPMFMDELYLSNLVLSYSPKSERAWSQRRWVIKTIAKMHPNLPKVVERESELVKTIVENSKMNYRAWNHRCWLVSYMSDSQVLNALQNSRDWSRRHVADNSCFHYRARLILHMVENLRKNHNPGSLFCANFHRILKEELDWVVLLIKGYVGREALWLHRRFLSLLWMKYLESGDPSISSCHFCCRSSENCKISMFINNELELFRFCTIMPDNDFGDYEAQATYAATYLLWLGKQLPMSFGVELRRSSHCGEIEKLLKSAGKNCLWDSWTANL